YRRGELLYGQGGPGTQIVTDEQSFVLKGAYAEQAGLWPRKPAQPDSTPTPTTGSTLPPDTPTATPTSVEGPAGGSKLTVDEPGRALRAEGPLREALGIIFERARNAGHTSLRQLTIQCFEAGDLFRLIPAANGVANAGKMVLLEVELEMAEEGVLTLTFNGPLTEAQLVREFLQPQLATARDRNARMLALTLNFSEGLMLADQE